LPFVHVEGQTTPQAPQFFGSVASVASHPFAGIASQSAVPALQAYAHAFDRHETTAFGSAGHAMQVGPHALMSVSAAHVFVAAQAWNWGLHVKSHAPPVHTGVPCATAGHATLQLPQWFTLDMGSTHCLPHKSGASAPHPVAHWKEGPTGVQLGAAAPHVPLQEPQLEGLDRSVSQPSLLFLLQSAYPGSQVPTEHAPPMQTAVLRFTMHAVHVVSPHP